MNNKPDSHSVDVPIVLLMRQRSYWDHYFWQVLITLKIYVVEPLEEVSNQVT
jgi:hypothetical protein